MEDDASATAPGLSRDEGDKLWDRTQAKIKGAADTSQGNNIVVVTRVRPFNKREKDLNTTNCIDVQAETADNNQIWLVRVGRGNAFGVDNPPPPSNLVSLLFFLID